MRITFISPPPDRTGGQRVIATYADRLGRRGHQVLVLAPPKRKQRVRAMARSLIRDGIWPSFASVPSHYDDMGVKYQLLDRFRPVDNADAPDADIVIATWWETAEWVMNLSAAKGAKVYFVQGHEVFAPIPAERSRATYRMPMQKIVVAQWLADTMRNEYGDPTAQVVPNSVDLHLFRANVRGRNLQPTVGFMYAPQTFKGTDISLDAISLARKSIPDLKVIAFGHGRPEAELPLPAGTEYYINPPQETIRSIYERCDAWLFGSRSEGFGLPILEAMACRTPVIGTPAGAAPGLLAGGGGQLVKPEDPEDMAAAIVRLFGLSDERWRKISDAAYSTASQYTWDDATDLFEAVLQTAAAKEDISALQLHAPEAPTNV